MWECGTMLCALFSLTIIFLAVLLHIDLQLAFGSLAVGFTV